MNPTIQPGMHPDAESLTAFAEQLLPPPEREEILAHMSACSRCREVVFLAQQAAEEDQPAPVAATVMDAPIKSRSSWFNWRWAWIPAAACAGIIGVAIVQHSRRVPTETQTAANVAPTDSLQVPEPPKAETQKPSAQVEPKPAKPSKSSGLIAEREIPQSLARDEDKKLDANKPADQKDLAFEPAAPPASLAPGVTGGSMHGTMAARAKSAQIGGPSAANQFQQQNLANQQNTLQQSSAAQLDAATSKINEAPAPRSDAETVTVQGRNVAPPPVAEAKAPAQINVTPATDQKEEASPANFAAIRKKQKVSLPGGLEALSVANIADRTIALNTNGTLFLSEDGAKHWKPVPTQWTGRAVLVRSIGTAEKERALSDLKVSAPAKFELVTDDLQTWMSSDGTTWTLKPISAK